MDRQAVVAARERRGWPGVVGDGGRRGGGRDRGGLPAALLYFMSELGALKGSGVWRRAPCCFHEDAGASLSMNVETGAFHCFGCEVRGDRVAFHRRRHGVALPEACKGVAAEGAP